MIVKATLALKWNDGAWNWDINTSSGWAARTHSRARRGLVASALSARQLRERKLHCRAAQQYARHNRQQRHSPVDNRATAAGQL